jgi:hypothetical protein
MDDFDFDFGDWLGDIESGLDLSGGDTSWLDDVDWGSMMDTLDFSNLDLSNVYGDISAGGLGGFEDVVITGQQALDPFEVDELTSRDEFDALFSSVDPFEIDGFQGSRDEFNALTGLEDPYGIDGLQGSRDEFNALTGLEDPFEVDGRQGSRDEDTALVGTDTGQEDIVITGKKTDDGKTSILTDEEHTRTGGGDDEEEPCPPNSNVTYTTEDGTKIVRDCKGRIISETKKTDTKTDTKKTTTTSTDNKLLEQILALLGGIMGLQNKPRPVGYQGGIPKYIATRGTPTSPTAGGRRPGGAGIPSLTGGITYTPVGAAQGGLMGLAAGGKARPARFLAGGTDGMADKIQTSIDGKQPARLSHGEFVIPADVVSHLGNGNSDAGAKVLYDMMAKVRKARTGNSKQGKQINPRKYTPV